MAFPIDKTAFIFNFFNFNLTALSFFFYFFKGALNDSRNTDFIKP